MTTCFIPARELKKSFKVTGHFYAVKLSQSITVQCRSVLEIVRNGHSADLPDAIFVMMNPGSSKPLSTTPVSVFKRGSPLVPIALEDARPDTTQYQIMRIMHYRDWNRIRVLNLSDLREAKSAMFAARFVEIEALHGYLEHSIFHPTRHTELADALKRKPKAPIVCAWGVSSKLDPLINQCTRAIACQPQRGLGKPGADGKYFHPLPTLQADKLMWVDRMVKHLAQS